MSHRSPLPFLLYYARVKRRLDPFFLPAKFQESCVGCCPQRSLLPNQKSEDLWSAVPLIQTPVRIPSTTTGFVGKYENESLTALLRIARRRLAQV